MKRAFLSFVALLATVSSALAISDASIPPKFSIPWGNSAGSSYIRSIPTPSQIGIQNCAASLTDGFPPLTFVPSSAGGCGPFGQDMNGILKQLSQWGLWQAAGGPVAYDSSFSTSIGGYPKGAILSASGILGQFWLSTIDNNPSNPDAGGGNWTPFQVAKFSGTLTFGGTGGGSANAQTATISNLTDYAQIVGVTITYVPGFSNTTAATLNLNGIGAVAIKRQTSIGLVPLGGTIANGGGGSELVAGQMASLVYDGTQFELVGVIPGPVYLSLTSGSGNYTTPIGATGLDVFEVGGGGGGAGTGSPVGGNGTSGGASSFNSIVAAAGIAGTANNANNAGGGGAGGSSGAGIAYRRTQGLNGASGIVQPSPAINIPPSAGGGSCALGGGLSSNPPNGAGSGGPSGGSSNSTVATSGGGGGGECAWFTVVGPLSATYSYSIGAAGTGGLAGSLGQAGTQGGSGTVVVKATFN